MIKKSWKILLVISFVLLLTACQSGKQGEQKEELIVKTEVESKTIIDGETEVEDKEGSKVIDAQENNQVLGEKQKEGQLIHGDFEEFSDYIKEIDRLLDVPGGYILKEVQTGIKQNKEDVVRLRYGLPDEEISLYGSHFSAVFKIADQSLLGFMSINPEGIIASVNDLPSKKETTQITKDFLEKIEPGFFATLDNMWVNQHDEPIVIEGQEQVVSGNKYKAYVPSDGSYMWVVVDKNQKIIIFERGIIWESGRTTEKWLYDEYLLDGTLELFAVKQN